MLEILILVLLCSLLSVGVNSATKFRDYEAFDEHPEMYRNVKIQEKMILWFIRYYGSYLPEYFRKPLYECIICMASVWSVAPVVMYVQHSGIDPIHALIAFPFFVGIVAGVNTILANRVL